MPTDFRIEVTLDDYRALLAFVQTRARSATFRGTNPTIARLLTFMTWMGIGIALAILASTFGGQIHLPSAIGAAILILTAFYWQMKKLQDQMLPQPDGAVLGSHLYQIREDGIHVQSSYGAMHLVWQGIKSLEETPTHFFLFIDRSVGFVLPKRSFAGESQLHYFKATVTERCGSRANSTHHNN